MTRVQGVRCFNISFIVDNLSLLTFVISYLTTDLYFNFNMYLKKEIKLIYTRGPKLSSPFDLKCDMSNLSRPVIVEITYERNILV